MLTYAGFWEALDSVHASILRHVEHVMSAADAVENGGSGGGAAADVAADVAAVPADVAAVPADVAAVPADAAAVVNARDARGVHAEKDLLNEAE
jgi:hypothetical protein